MSHTFLLLRFRFTNVQHPSTDELIGPQSNHLCVWIQHTSADLHTQLLRTASHQVGTVCEPIISKTSWEWRSAVLMDQPASYTKIIPQLILLGKEEEGAEKQYHKPHPSRLQDRADIIPSSVCVPFKVTSTSQKKKEP